MLLRDLSFYFSYLFKKGVYTIRVSFAEKDKPMYNQTMTLYIRVDEDGATIKTYSDLYREAGLDDIVQIVEVRPVIDSWSML